MIVFFFNDTATTEIYTLSLHDALPIFKSYNLRGFSFREFLNLQTGMKFRAYTLEDILSNHEQIAKGILSKVHRSEEHTSELQSRQYLVCRLLLEKKKKI